MEVMKVNGFHVAWYCLLTLPGGALPLGHLITLRDPRRARPGKEDSWIFCAQIFRSA